MTREEAIERIKSRYDKWALDDNDLEAIQYIFPELKENEDERLRREIISALKFASNDGIYDKHIAYLESLKEQKPMHALTKDQYVEKFRSLCDSYEIKLPNRAYDIYHLCNDLAELFGNAGNREENILPKDIERDATQFCFDNGINITPHQAWKIASHYQVIGFNAGMDEAHIQAKEVMKHPEKYGLQKEKKETVNIDQFKSFMLQYLQDAANRKDDSEIEADTDKWAHKLLSLIGVEPKKPVVFDEERNVNRGAKGKIMTEEDFKALRNWLVEHGYYVGNNEVAEALRKLADMWDD